jgi:hypothetical protein
MAMDEIRVVRRRTYVWPVVIAVIVLAIVIAWVLFGLTADSLPTFGLVPSPGAPGVGV